MARLSWKFTALCGTHSTSKCPSLKVYLQQFLFETHVIHILSGWSTIFFYSTTVAPSCITLLVGHKSRFGQWLFLTSSLFCDTFPPWEPVQETEEWIFASLKSPASNESLAFGAQFRQRWIVHKFSFLQVLKSTAPLELSDMVLGQYVGDPDSSDPDARMGYLDDPTVPKGSVTPTFAAAVLRINNERWEGVPFILKAGRKYNQSLFLILISLPIVWW